MNYIDFGNLLERRQELMTEVLAVKSEEYSSASDKLYNFKRAAAMQDITPEKALQGMWAKHVVSIMDLIARPDKLTERLIDEKIGDAINYLVLLEALWVERIKRGNAAPGV